MNLCSDGHNEVCYEDRKCPACEVIADKSAIIEELENEIHGLESMNANLEAERDAALTSNAE